MLFEKMAALRDALADLGYEGIEGALYYQFRREVNYLSQRRAVKMGLLASLPEDEEARRALKYDARRVHPRSVKNTHAHTSPEALTVGEHLRAYPVLKLAHCDLSCITSRIKV